MEGYSLISGVFEHSVLRVREIYAWCFALQSMGCTNKFPIDGNTQCSNATEILGIVQFAQVKLVNLT